MTENTNEIDPEAEPLLEGQKVFKGPRIFEMIFNE
jgi:hypothetical protein